jgi:hypothetical protein
MATWYTDIAANQLQGVNFEGETGEGTLTTQPGTQNNPVLEGPPDIIATYTWTGNEVNNDLIYLAIAPAGVVVSPNGHVSSGLTAPATTLTLAIGDLDLALPTLQPITNAAALVSQGAVVGGSVAPNWVSATAYAVGNVVTDPNSTPANLTYTCVLAQTSANTTAPHSAANTSWMPNNQRYSNTIDCHAASGNVAFAAGTQLYGGPLSILPNSTTPNSVPTNATAAQIANSAYQIQGPGGAWITAIVLTSNTIAANAVSVFRIGLTASN